MRNAKKLSKKLVLSKVTVTNLNNAQLNDINGGVNSGYPICTNSDVVNICDTYDKFGCGVSTQCPMDPTNDPGDCSIATCPPTFNKTF